MLKGFGGKGVQQQVAGLQKKPKEPPKVAISPTVFGNRVAKSSRGRSPSTHDSTGTIASSRKNIKNVTTAGLGIPSSGRSRATSLETRRSRAASFWGSHPIRRRVPLNRNVRVYITIRRRPKSDTVAHFPSHRTQRRVPKCQLPRLHLMTFVYITVQKKSNIVTASVNHPIVGLS